MKSLIYSSIILLLFSCQKKPVTNEHAEFEGAWRHIQNSQRAMYITIYADSRGYTEAYNYSTGELLQDSQNRKWRYKKGKLYFSWWATGTDVYTVDQEPKIATDVIIKGLDTAYLGDRYMILDGDLYTDRN